MSDINEECGVFGVYSKEKANIASTVYYGLYALQHRGQESCGIVINDNGTFNYYRDMGLIKDVFTPERLEKLGAGNIAVGHVKYGAENEGNRVNAQPIVINHVKGKMALAHNGNIINNTELREKLEMEGSIFHSTSDAEIISYIITKERIKCNSIEEAISNSLDIIKGAYSLVIMTAGKLIIARDKNGFRPLCYGKTDDGRYIVASESCALDAVGAKLIRDVEPGEIILFDQNGITSNTRHCNKAKKTLCIFENIYFARPDSAIDGISVHQSRVIAGECLAEEYPVDADVVIGVPDSGLDAALGYARKSGIHYSMGFIKNRYIGRTFIAPGQKSREDKVKIKLNVIKETIKGKRVVMIDDSIVRGTTCARIVKLLRDAGATEVHMRVTAPPFLNPCYYGTDIASRDKLIACNHSIEEIAKIIGVDSLGYLKIEDLAKMINAKDNSSICTACFDNNYPTEIPNK